MKNELNGGKNCIEFYECKKYLMRRQDVQNNE